MEGGKHIKLSLGQEPGEFHLCLDGVGITINLTAQSAGKAETLTTEAPAAAVAPPAMNQTASGPAAGDAQALVQVTAELDRYREVSLEIYEALGKLAKDINVSIQDLSLAEIIETGMGSPGEHLDQARHQVADVLLMTEQATLNIMDLVEQIREDCQAVQAKLLNLAQPQAAEVLGADQVEVSLGAEDAPSLWTEVLSQAEKLDRLLTNEEFEADPPANGVPHFPLAEIFQILLEFCTNETVKQHLKAVQAKQDAIFGVREAEQALTLLAANLTPEEGFYQLPIEPVLDLLKSHCEDDRVKELFTKMATSAGKLFPVSALPLEAQRLEGDFAGDLASFHTNPKVASCWAELHQSLKLLAENRQATAGGPAAGAGTGGTVQEVLDTVDRITTSLSRIIESLAFQDLSGQRLLKVLKILRQLQVQILALLVGLGHKLPAKMDNQAREELHRLLHSLASASDQHAAFPPEEQPLDQNAINELLTGMGF